MIDVILLVLVFAGLIVFILSNLKVTSKSEGEKSESIDSGERKTSQGCLHFYGYLAGKASQKIPDECLSCVRVTDCMEPTETYTLQEW